MPDHRKHRGPHPEDQGLFAPGNWPRLRAAVNDLNWLLSRSYASPSALKIVGDRYALDARQRVAVSRCACSDTAVTRRKRHEIPPAALENRELWIDGYNVLTSIESALSGGVILHARDGCYRDMASMHGTYRTVQETVPAIQIVGELTTEWRVRSCRWLLDQPVSNSGRLKGAILTVAAEQRWHWDAELVAAPDPMLRQCEHVVATADSHILDHVGRWFNMARHVIDLRIPAAWIVNLAD